MHTLRYSNANMARSAQARDLSQTNVNRIVVCLSLSCTDGRLPYGALAAEALEFGLHRNAVSKMWTNRASVPQYSTLRAGNCGAKPIFAKEDLEDPIKSVPLEKRRTICAKAKAQNV